MPVPTSTNLNTARVPPHRMDWLKRAIRIMMRVAKLLASAISNLFEGLSAAALRFVQEAAALIEGFLPKTDKNALVRQIKKSIKGSGNWVRDNPCQAAFIAIFIFAITAAPMPVSPVSAAVGSTDVGSTAVGPATGTSAAAVQSLICPVAAGSTFAILQSAAMLGYRPPILVGSIQTVAAAGLIVVLCEVFGGKGGCDDNPANYRIPRVEGYKDVRM